MDQPAEISTTRSNNNYNQKKNVNSPAHAPRDKNHQKKSHPPLGVVVIGNPGTGKSTILNGLTGTPAFRSGMSFGTGLTVHMQEKIINEISYFDTPGLDDIDMRENAGAEIDKVLSRGQDLKLIFVVTELNGRVHPEDATTISLVLDAVQNGRKEKDSLNDCFAVIINQASSEFITQMSTEPMVERTVRSKLLGQRKTKYWVYIKNNPEFTSKENGVLKNDELTTLVQNLPVGKHNNENVSKVDAAAFSDRLAREVQVFKEIEVGLQQELNIKAAIVKGEEKNVEEVQQKILDEQRKKEKILEQIETAKNDLNHAKNVQNNADRAREQIRKETGCANDTELQNGQEQHKILKNGQQNIKNSKSITKQRHTGMKNDTKEFLEEGNGFYGRIKQAIKGKMPHTSSEHCQRHSVKRHNQIMQGNNQSALGINTQHGLSTAARKSKQSQPSAEVMGDCSQHGSESQEIDITSGKEPIMGRSVQSDEAAGQNNTVGVTTTQEIHTSVTTTIVMHNNIIIKPDSHKEM